MNKKLINNQYGSLSVFFLRIFQFAERFFIVNPVMNDFRIAENFVASFCEWDNITEVERSVVEGNAYRQNLSEIDTFYTATVGCARNFVLNCAYSECRNLGRNDLEHRNTAGKTFIK